MILKFTEPLDAAVPSDQWKIYPFKGEESLGKLPLHFEFVLDPIPLYGASATCFLFGRDGRVADIVLENPSCSMQHCVVQFREKHVTRPLSIEEQTARGLY